MFLNIKMAQNLKVFQYFCRDSANMDNFSVTILGCGSAKPTLRHNPSAQLVCVNSKSFLIDCGEGTQTQLMRAHCKFNRLRHIFISHLHGDHCYGLPGLLSTMGLTGLDGETIVHLPKVGVALLKPLVDYSAHDLNVRFEPLPESGGIVYDDRSLTVTSVPLVHRLPCYGFIFKEKPKPRHINPEAMMRWQIPTCYRNNIKAGADYTTPDGIVVPNAELTTDADPQRAYAYISDTLPLKGVVEAVRGVDLLYHEATFTSDLRRRARQTCHTTAADAARIAHDAAVKRLVIGHFSSRYLNEAPLLDEAKAVFANTLLACEGLTITI